MKEHIPVKASFRGDSMYGIAKPEKLVVRTQEAFETLCINMYPPCRLGIGLRPRPRVSPDFTNEMMLAVFLGDCPQGNYSIEITSITKNSQNIEVAVREVKPREEDNCRNKWIRIYPYHLVVIPRYDGRINFVEG